jgi:hypothetical protein
MTIVDADAATWPLVTFIGILVVAHAFGSLPALVKVTHRPPTPRHANRAGGTHRVDR